jgi:hypothetical protein
MTVSFRIVFLGVCFFCLDARTNLEIPLDDCYLSKLRIRMVLYTEENHSVLRTLPCSVPDEIGEYVNFGVNSTDDPGGNADFMSNAFSIRIMYIIRAIQNGNTVGYASFLEEYARYADLAQFEEVYAPYTVGENVCFLPLSRRLEIDYWPNHSSQSSNSMGAQ